MDLFEHRLSIEHRHEPLAARMRPRTFDDFVGQEHLVGPDAVLRQAVEADRLQSAIFYGPPGCGKSTLAHVIAQTTRSRFVTFSAVTSGVKDARQAIEQARRRLAESDVRTILFVDEIHRFNRAQQDAFLPHVEEGVIILIGATTENPFFSVNAPLLSRSQVLRFEPLDEGCLNAIIDRALSDRERGLGAWELALDDDARNHLLTIANGDARRALNALEAAAAALAESGDDARTICLDLVERAAQTRAVHYDRSGDAHYDVISAFIKSIRGSDPDAAVYWLARMLEAGEDPVFIARRLVIHAAEDVGNADPMALVVAASAAQAVTLVGLPECQIPLSQATIYLATAPKSNASCVAIHQARADVANCPHPPVPVHLRDASYRGARELGHGAGYKYPHDFPGNWVDQCYLDKSGLNTPYYVPTEHGHEATIKQRLDRIAAGRQGGGGHEGPDDRLDQQG